MRFDVIIGNPPYQDNDGGGTGTSATPIYNKFIEESIKISRITCMIIPARWYTGGKGLDGFRNIMLGKRKIKELHDYPLNYEIFNSVKITGGVCYFLYDNDYTGDCKVVTHKNGQIQSEVIRDISKYSIFIRDNEVSNLLDKIDIQNSIRFSTLVSERNTYSLNSDYFVNWEKQGLPEPQQYKGDRVYRVYGVVGNKREIRYIPNTTYISDKHNSIDKYKVFLSKTIDSDNMINYKLQPFLGLPGDISTETYLMIGPFDTEQQANLIIDYIKSELFHKILLGIASSQNISRSNFDWIPINEELYNNIYMENK